MNSQSQNENALTEAKKIVKAQVKKNTFLSIICAFIFYIIAFFCNIDTHEINQTILLLNTNFGITLCAFSLSALAIIYALHDKKIIERFNKTPGYFVMILVFQKTIWFCLINFLNGYIGMLLISNLNKQMNLLLTSISITLILLAIFFVKKCADSIFTVIKSL